MGDRGGKREEEHASSPHSFSRAPKARRATQTRHPLTTTNSGTLSVAHSLPPPPNPPSPLPHDHCLLDHPLPSNSAFSLPLHVFPVCPLLHEAWSFWCMVNGYPICIYLLLPGTHSSSGRKMRRACQDNI